ncbi:hypothetical protein G7075_18365 [Phycicoccus sp. HDW14]|uniref:hypothetical protein n=1 Tax=Phycicoccus sp. HDW14 TaxID=2714941 RepID=UPI00140B1244|nr:hypothetical protein [Phycicoccus sp. HDW14]QIM22643.1 hypothetical protein G7075_18365 [Phycicoccus sp. HDW14]
MNTWIKRSLGTAAVAGGLLLGGAAMASADDGSSASQHAADSSVSSPIRLGGIDLGATSSSSKSSSVTETRTDRDGSSESSTRASKDSSKNSVGLSTGDITADPSAAISSITKSATSRDSDADTSRSSSSSEGRATAKAPVSIGGLNLTGSNEQASSGREKVTRTDEDGDTRTSESESAKASKTGYSFGIGELTADPMGSLSGARSDALTRDDEDVTGASTSEAAGSFSSPLSFEGITGSFSDERASTDARRDTVTDEDGTRSQATREARASKTTGGFDTGSFAADPNGAFRTVRSDAFSTRDRDETADRSTSTSVFDLAAPYSASGGSGFFSREDASATERETMVSDEDGTLTRIERDEDANAFGQSFGFDRSEGDLLGSFDATSVFDGMVDNR